MIEEGIEQRINALRERGIEPNVILMGGQSFLPVSNMRGFAEAGDHFMGLPLVNDNVVDEVTPAKVETNGRDTFYYY